MAQTLETKRSKHIDVRYHFFERSNCQQKNKSGIRSHTRSLLADGFTKATENRDIEFLLSVLKH